MKRQRPEQALQIQVVNYLRAVCPEAITAAIPNGGYRTPVEAMIFKATGVTAGIPDLMILWKPSKVGFIELKAPKAKTRLSDAQKSFQVSLSQMDHLNATASSLDEIRAIVRVWGIPSREHV